MALGIDAHSGGASDGAHIFLRQRRGWKGGGEHLSGQFPKKLAEKADRDNRSDRREAVIFFSYFEPPGFVDVIFKIVLARPARANNCCWARLQCMVWYLVLLRDPTQTVTLSALFREWSLQNF